ncbi:MAG: hypothetical protein M2R45_04620 [Verrucomicrobia subdivision 3 bacterium]|nr:hypothetical protein [Limisphaerales bacterium]MCS1417317.1 hypothetical protein [Limisphaerales bacterium]
MMSSGALILQLGLQLIMQGAEVSWIPKALFLVSPTV